MNPILEAPVASTRTLRWIVGAAVGWMLLTGLALLLGRAGLPFDQPLLAKTPLAGQIQSAWLGLLFCLLLVGLTVWLTRRRARPDFAARVGARPLVIRETTGMLLYGVVAQALGWVLGHAVGPAAISLHLPGSLYGTSLHISTGWAVLWAGFNFLVYAVVPFWWFRRRGYSNRQLSLHSQDRRGDLILIGVVLVLESTAEFLSISSATLHLDTRQLLLGIPSAFLLNFVGTVLPVMIFIYSLLLPRYLALTGSAVGTVVLGGLTYAAVHLFDSWTDFHSVRSSALSVVFLLFAYFSPGVVKSALTLRTGNAWVHVWSYHAIAPHVTVDTSTVVHQFHIHQ